MDRDRVTYFYSGCITLPHIVQLSEHTLSYGFCIFQRLYFINFEHYYVHDVFNRLIMEYKDTEIIIAIVAASILFILLTGFIVAFLFFYNRKKRIHFEELKEQQRFLKEEGFRSEMEIREQTLRHISEEIHDNVGQLMLVAKLNLNKFLMATSNKAMEETRDIVGEAINDLRDISKSLHREQITSLDLCKAIEKELQRLKKTGLVETLFSVEGEIAEIDSSKKLIFVPNDSGNSPEYSQTFPKQ